MPVKGGCFAVIRAIRFRRQVESVQKFRDARGFSVALQAEQNFRDDDATQQDRLVFAPASRSASGEGWPLK